MIKYYCDLCNGETQPLRHHGFMQYVQISEVVEMDTKEFFIRFYVCDSCRKIWNTLALEFVQAVKDQVDKRVEQQ